MFRRIFRKFNWLRLNVLNESSDLNKNNKKEGIPKSIKDIKTRLYEIFSECSDFSVREIVIGQNNNIKIIVVYLEGLVEKEIIDNNILRPLLTEAKMADYDREIKNNNASKIIKENLLSISRVKSVADFTQAIENILSGNSVIFIDGSKEALIEETKAFETRGVQEPDTESVVRGPREGFSEDLRVNTALIRRKIKNANLKIETIKLGKETNTDICICYIKGIVREDILRTVKRRLKKINTDAILESGYLEEFIEDAPFSIFPTVGNTEKPDVAAAKLLEGRVAIICDGTPFVLTVPYLFVESLQTSEDYYSRYFFSSFIRLIRIIAINISTLVPALYVALICFHQEMIPTKLMVAVAASREGIPFPPLFEALIMSLAFELLREAGVRMPRPVGQAVSIVGALVLGEAAVDANIVSNLMVIVIALTAIASFIIPPMAGTIPFIRYAMLIGANVFGLMGVALVGTAFYIHVCSIRSFGVPYMYPFSPLNVRDLKDTFVRMPIWTMVTRPKVLTSTNDDESNYRMKVDFRKKED